MTGGPYAGRERSSMRQLRLVGLNEDGSRLVLRDEGAKADYLLPLDERLSAALRGDRARLGQLEITLESQLRPREMQSRVRAGESPQQVAKAAGLPLDRVLRFVAPVIAEREHIVEVARRAPVRRAGADGPGPILETTVVERLAAKDVAEDSLEWDAWRRDDGRWTVQVGYQVDGRERVAQWSYDAGARSAVALDDEARALTGSRPAPAPDPAEAEDDASMAAERDAWDVHPPRLATVPNGPDDSDDVGVRAYAALSGESADAGYDLESEAVEARAGGRAPRGRAHVPSWDEIMFGRRRTRE
jgi:hypothetical protein